MHCKFDHSEMIFGTFFGEHPLTMTATMDDDDKEESNGDNFYTSTTTKLMILFYFNYHTYFPLYHNQTSDFHLPDDCATSPYYPPLSPPLFGWSWCVSSSNGNSLRHRIIYLFVHVVVLVITWRDNIPHTL